jgi:outer membrane protein, heavy metal efflux system
MRLKFLCFGLFFIYTMGWLEIRVMGQADTLKYTLPQLEKQFADSNLLLLAQKYSIEENEANMIQAKIWDLPNFTINHNLYNPENKKYLEIAPGSETSIQVEQLILIAGKRNKQVSMAKITRDVAQYQYFDLLRTLKFQLHSAFYSVHFLENKLSIYALEVPMLARIVSGYEQMYPKGMVSLKEVVRLKALLFSLESEKLDLVNQLTENENVLRVMTRQKGRKYIQPVADTAWMDKVSIDKLRLESLIDTAFHNRFDLLASGIQQKFAQTDLSYQKALAVPNPSVIAGWDHNGGYVKNYNYVGLSFDLPLWNRNRGNIRAAEARVEESKALYGNQLLQIEGEVNQSYTKALETDRLYHSSEANFGADFTKIITGTTESFLKHEIGLIEFVDLFDSFKESQINLFQLQYDRINAIEGLNYAVGKSLN